MTTVFISYARADGLHAATRLREQLSNAGLTVWRDMEEMAGGQAWKEQLRAALRQVDALVVLLTPGAVASTTVGWEWENALTLQKRVLPLLIAACEVPAELKRLHYHDLTTPARHAANFPKLLRDLYELSMKPGESQMPTPSNRASTYIVHQATNTSVGDNATTLNISGQPSTHQLQSALALLRHVRPAAPDGNNQLEEKIDEILARTMRIEDNVKELLAGQLRILVRFDASEQAILNGVVSQLNQQQVELLEAMLCAVEIQETTTGQLAAILHHVETGVAALMVRPPVDASLVAQIAAIHALLQPQLVDEPAMDVRHRLKVTLPLLPGLISYEGEADLAGRLNLESGWRALRTLAGR